MEQAEVEVLEGTNNWERDIAVLAEVVEVEVPVQQIIVNNEVQQIMGKACVLICPKCGCIIQQFQPGATKEQVTIALNAPDDKPTTMYCHKCGQKLQLLRYPPVEGKYDVQENSK